MRKTTLPKARPENSGFRWRWTLAMAVILLIGMIGYLLGYSYLTQRRLLTAGAVRLEENLAGRVKAVQYFLQEREKDMRELAEGNLVKAYFSNKALGMSLEYGLKGSLNHIKRQLRHLNAAVTVTGTPIYARLALFSATGEVLAEYQGVSPCPIRKCDWQTVAATSRRLSAVLPDKNNPSYLLVTAPARQQGTVVGYLAGWVALSVIHDRFLSVLQKNPGHASGTINTIIIMAGKTGWFSGLSPDHEAIQSLKQHLAMDGMAKNDPTKMRDWYREAHDEHGDYHLLDAGHAGIPKYVAITARLSEEVQLVHLLKQEDVLDPHGPRRLSVILTVLTFAVLGIAFLAFRRNTEARVLAARLNESDKKQVEITRANESLSLEIEQRQEIEKQLAQEKERLELVIHGTNIGTWEWNVLTGETIFNERWADILGYTLAEISPTNMQTWKDFCHPEDLERSSTKIERHFSRELDYYSCECRMRHKNGHWVWIHDRGRVVEWAKDGTPVRMAGTHADISDRKRAETLLRQANETLEQRVQERTAEIEQMHGQMVMQEKMASIGQLAAGISHELNNPINFVRTNFAALADNFSDLVEILNAYRTLANADVPSKHVSDLRAVRAKETALEIEYILDDLPSLFAESENGFKRIARIIQSMRNFSHSGSTGEYNYFNINKGIEDTLVIARNVYKYHAEVKTDLGVLPDVHCLPDQLNQVFLNLIVNSAQAIDAKPGRGKGEIVVRTWQADQYVCCEIADNGPGISPEIQSRIFDPFFTTKDPGRGTGLGLSISYDIIVHKHKGELSVTCPETGGTVFSIRIPMN